MTQGAREGFRLSPQQRRLWLLQQDGSIFPASCAVLLEGELDRGALAAALREVVRRHQILRTVFHRPAGLKLPLQVVEEGIDAGWAEIAAEPEEPWIADWKPGDLERGPVLRARLIAAGGVLLLDLPALCADGRGLDNLCRELAGAYVAALAGGTLEGEVFQYVQFSEWQNMLVEEAETAGGEAFWRQRLPDGAAAQVLPFERPLMEPRPFELRSRRTEIVRETAEACAELAERSGSSLRTVLLGAWMGLLWRLGGEDDLVVGTLFAGREFEVLEGALGVLARSLPVRSRLDERLDGDQLLRRLHAEIQEVGERADDFGLEAALADASGNPAFLPFAFELEELPAPFHAGGLTLSLVRKVCAVDRFHLRLSCAVREKGLAAEVFFDPARFDAVDAGRLADWYARFLESLVRSPDRLLTDLELLAPGEREEVLAGGRGPESPRGEGSSVHELFLRTAERLPGQPAVVQGERCLTYRELEVRSGELAARLREAGVGPESLVGLFLERSIEMIVGLLGILRAGGAYVPLDPTLPAERLRLMTRSIGVRVVVILPSQPGPFGAEVRQVGVEEGDAGELRPGGVEALPENLVYVLFTSGSTGVPKGVAVEHRHLTRYTAAVGERLGLTEGAEGSRFGVVSTIGADLGNTTLFPSLTSGGCLCLASEEEAMNPERFRDFMRRNRIDCLKITPTHLSALLGPAPGPESLPEQVLVLGGEPSDARWIQKLRSLAPHCRFLNHYGPTETTVGVMTRALEEALPETGPVPLGRPIAGARVYLLDDRLAPVPPGVPGEVHIGGAGVSRGYLGRPAETARAFIPDPFATAPGERLYRSGDLARSLPGGDLLFMGRRDHQVKLRGFRVELGEVEAVLRALPGIEEAVAAVREDAPGDRRLVAYFVAGTGAQSDPQARRTELRNRLPEHMVPAVLVPLKALPRTASGKVDRRSLPIPGQGTRDRTFVAPRTALEEIVAGIWAEVLKLERIGAEDDFFELGGHSLLAIQIVSRLKETFRVDLPLRTVFQASSVTQLSQALIQAEASPGQVEKIARAIQKIRAMSPEEVQRTLAAKRAGAT